MVHPQRCPLFQEGRALFGPEKGEKGGCIKAWVTREITAPERKCATNEARNDQKKKREIPKKRGIELKMSMKKTGGLKEINDSGVWGIDRGGKGFWVV